MLLTNKTETNLRVRRGQLTSIPCSYESIPRDTVHLTWSRRKTGERNYEDVDVGGRDWVQLENGKEMML